MTDQDISELRKEQTKRISELLNKYSTFSKAPDMLNKSIIDVSAMLVKHKGKSDTDAYKMFKSVNKTMLMAFNFINDLSAIYQQNFTLKTQIRMLNEMLRMSESELNVYRSIEQGMLEGDLKQKIKTVNEKLKNNG